MEFDHLLERFLWRDPQKMSFRELTCAFAIADYARGLIWEELESRGHLGPSKLLTATTPKCRFEDSDISDGYYTDYEVDPVSEREFELHLQFVFTDPIAQSSNDDLVDLISAAYGARDRIANALARMGVLFTSHPDVVDILGSAHPLSRQLRTEDDPHMPRAIPERYRVSRKL